MNLTMAQYGLQAMQIAPTALTHVPYGAEELPVWGHTQNKDRQFNRQKFFVMPLVMFILESVECETSPMTEQTGIYFGVQMWDENVAAAAVTHLRRVTGHKNLSSEQVTTLPIEQVRLVWANKGAMSLSNKFKFNHEWQPYAGQYNVLRFSIAVDSPDLCETTAKLLKKRPINILSNVDLQYVLHATQSSSRRVTVSGMHVQNGRMYAKLENVAKKGNGEVYLNSNDLNKFSLEIVSSVAASSTTDANYIDHGDNVSLTKLVYDTLAVHKQTSESMTDKMWESTFWHDENSRPDKVTTFLNKVMTKNAENDHTVNVNDKETAVEGEASLKGSYWGFAAEAAAAGKKGSKAHVSVDKLKKWLKDNYNEVQWTGEKFEVKPMTLYRLNTQQLAQKQSIVTKDVQLRRVQHTYKVKMSFPTQIKQLAVQPTSAINNRIETLETQIEDLLAWRESPRNAILLIGGYVLEKGAETVEYYNPLGESSLAGRMSTRGIRGKTKQTSGCYFAATNQVVIREALNPDKLPFLYGLSDGSAKQLPLPQRNSSGTPVYTRLSTTASISPSKCISCGGREGYDQFLNNCYQFDSAVEEWTPISPMPHRLSSAASVHLKGNNSYYVIGGWDGSFQSKKLYRYDVQQGKWHEESPMTEQLHAHAAAPLSNTEFIVGGGLHSKKSCEVYDSTTGRWRTVGSFNIGRHGYALINFNNDVYALGGWGDGGQLSSVEMFDRSTESWKLVKSLKHPREYSVAVAI